MYCSLHTQVVTNVQTLTRLRHRLYLHCKHTLNSIHFDIVCPATMKDFARQEYSVKVDRKDINWSRYL